MSERTEIELHWPEDDEPERESWIDGIPLSPLVRLL